MPSLNEKQLREKIQNDPSDWESRRRLAHVLYDKNEFVEAGDVVWGADEIPSTDIDLAYAARILSKAHPRKAIRLLTAVLELNRGKAVQNMGMANALLHHGLVLQAARFYGAALEADSSLVNPDLEHFILWTDEEMTLWGDFKGRRPKLGDLPWMARDPMEAMGLTARISLHTTPISVPSLPSVPGEDILNELYQQEIAKRGKITPPPAVTIPIDRVDPKHRRFDDRYGATVTNGSMDADTSNIPAMSAPTAAQVHIPVAPPATGSMSAKAPMAIPLPDNVVPVVPTAQLSPLQPPRTPGGIAGPVATASLSHGVGQAPTPTRKLITPGGKPTPTGQFLSPLPPTNTNAETGA